MKRCDWPGNDPLYIEYHDNEWGTPLHDDGKLFEAVILDGFQAGLNWLTILKKRENFRTAFDNFDPEIIARYDESKVRQLLQNEGIVRNKLKINSAVKNAKVFIEIQKEFKSFDAYIWAFVKGKTIKNKFKRMSQMPAQTELSDRISKYLKSRGMSFVGSTIVYAIIQSMGIVNDHLVTCFRYNEV